MSKIIKEKLALFTFLGIAIGLIMFPVWSHINQEQDIVSVNSRVDSVYDDLTQLKLTGEDLLVGASGFFAQNASVQLNLEVLGTYASTSGNLSFNGEIMPDGVTCGANDILKRTGANDWDCATDASGSVSSNSLNFDEFQNPLVLDLAITVTSGAFTWDWNGTKLLDINSASVSETFEIGQGAGARGSIKLGDAGVQLSHDGDGLITFLGLGNGSDEDLSWNFDDISNEVTITTSTGVANVNFSSIGLQESGIAVLSNDEIDASSELLAIMDDETGTGLLTFATAPTFTTNITLGATGVRVTDDADGALTFLGLSTGFDEDFTVNLDDVSNEVTFTTSTGVNRFLFSGINVSTSLSFEAVGHASASAFRGTAFSGDCDAAGDTLNWDVTNGTFSCGTDASGGAASNSLDFDEFVPLMTLDTNTSISYSTFNLELNLNSTGDFIISDNDTLVICSFSDTAEVNCGDAASFELPSAAGGSAVNAAGEVTVNTSSASFNIYDGTAERVLRDLVCKTWAYANPTETAMWGRVYFDDPFTIVNLAAITSRSSNAVGWNMQHGLTGAITTNVFTSNKSASGTFIYTSDNTVTNDLTLADGEYLMLRITSASRPVEELDITVCGRFDAAP